MTKADFAPLTQYTPRSESEMQQRAGDFLREMKRRRSVRQFSDRTVPRDVILDCVATAATAPSGANLQPWHFVIAESPRIKQCIRAAAEQEEREFYQRRASQQWLEDLAPLATDPSKPFLEAAPYLIVVFVERESRTPEGEMRKTYYALQSANIALGFLITAIHHAGLACLPYTPSRMGFLNTILEQPSYRRPTTVLAVGYPTEDAQVPVISKRPLEAVVSFA